MPESSDGDGVTRKSEKQAKAGRPGDDQRPKIATTEKDEPSLAEVLAPE
jgi:hypothetical protein